MTPEQKDALCEYVDGLRAAGQRYDEIAETLQGKLPEGELEMLEEWHREWKRREWREALKRLQTSVSIDSTDIAEARQACGEWSPVDSGGARELMEYLVDQMIGVDIGDDVGVRWKALYMRSLEAGQTCEMVRGPGQVNGRKWLYSAVIFRTGQRIDHVEAEARIRRRVRPGSSRAGDYRLTREAVQLEKLDLVREKLDRGEISARLAALLQTYLGKASGIKSGAHLARLTNRTRQAVSARKLLIAEDYYKRTGGRAGFEGLTSAGRHRDKVLDNITGHNEPPQK